MRSLRFAAALVLATLLHVAGIHLFSFFSSTVDLFLIIIVLNALDGDSLAGMLGGMAAGLVADALSGGLFGLHGLAGTIVGYGTAFAVQRLVIQRAPGVFLLFALAAAAQQVVLMAISLLMVSRPEAPGIVWPGVKAAATGVLGTLAYLGRERLGRRLERLRSARPTRIRFER